MLANQETEQRMWYTVKTIFDREEDAEKVLKAIPCIRETYLPYRRYLPSGINKASRPRFRPAISGILFINVSKKDTGKLKACLNNSGYFLDGNGKQYDFKAHLLSYSIDRITLDERISMSKVSPDAIALFKAVNQYGYSEKFFEGMEIIDPKSYNILSSKYDTVCILNGPLFKLQGIVKQNLDKKNKDRQLYIRFGAWTMVIPNIRKYNYIVVREAPDGVKAKTVNTWRYIDYVIGKLQAAYFPDNASEVLRNILAFLSKGKPLDTVRHELLHSSLDINGMEEKSGIALQAAFLATADSQTESCLEALNSFFRSSGESLEKGLNTLIPDVQLRPFLTPTPGKEIPAKDVYTLLEHDSFTEVILRLDLKKMFVDEKYKSPKGIKLTKDDYVYYAHIGLRESDDHRKLTAFVNWSGFMNAYLLMEGEEREALRADMAKKGYKHTPALLSANMVFRQSPELSGFKMMIGSDDTSKLMRKLRANLHKPLRFSLIRELYPVVELLKVTIPAAVELWQIPRLDSWRKLAQRYVLLHKMPVRQETNDNKWQ